MEKKNLFIDMDGVLAEWREDQTAKDTYRKGYFENLRPYSNVVDAVRQIISLYPDISVYILSAVYPDNNHAISEKRCWLKKYLPEIANENIFFVDCGCRKSAICPGMSFDDVLLDDYNANLDDWKQHGGTAVKVYNEVNSPVSTLYQVINKNDHPDAIVVDILHAIGYSLFASVKTVISAYCVLCITSKTKLSLAHMFMYE